jgi:hypothetical protein
MSSGKKAVPEVYKKMKTLGEGSFGKAYLVECQSDKVSLPFIYTCYMHINSKFTAIQSIFQYYFIELCSY